MRENTDQKNSEYGHFLHSELIEKSFLKDPLTTNNEM